MAGKTRNLDQEIDDLAAAIGMAGWMLAGAVSKLHKLRALIGNDQVIKRLAATLRLSPDEIAGVVTALELLVGRQAPTGAATTSTTNNKDVVVYGDVARDQDRDGDHRRPRHAPSR